MQICDGQGNLCSDFLQRLEQLKREQGENLRELERLKVDAFLQGRNVYTEQAEREMTRQMDGTESSGDINKTISEMWMDFNLSEKLNQVELPADIHEVSDRKSAPKMESQWTPKITVPQPFSMTLRHETNPRPPKHTRASLGNSFRARDVDENILEQSVNYDEVEDERQTRMKTRSQQLLRSASLPRRMKSAPVRIAKETQSEFTMRRRAHVVPDFKKLHQENARKMQEAKNKAEDERNRRPKTAAPILQTEKRAMENPKAVTFDEPDVVFRATKIAFTPDTPPIKANDSFALRKDFVRQTLDLLETQLRTEQESIKERKKKEREQSKRVRKSLPPKANQTNQVERLRELQQEDRTRLKEYRSMLNEIYNKVEQRPLLFTQS